MSADPPANYVDGGYRDSLLNTGAERVPIHEMKGGLRAARRQVNRLRGDQRRIGGDMPPAPPPSEENHNVPPVPTPPPSEESHNIPPTPTPEPKPVDFFAPKITKEEFYDSESNMLMSYEDFMGQLDKCGTLLGQLTVKCMTIKEIMYKILLYRLGNMIQLELGGEGAIGAAVLPKGRDYTADDLLVILRRLHELLGVQPAVIKGDVSDILERLSGLIGLLGSIRALAGPERTLASPALDMLAELQRLLEVLNISKQPAPTSVPDALSILEQLRTLLSEVPGAPLPAVLDQLNRLLGLLGQVSPGGVAATATAPVPDIITSLNDLLELLNIASVSTLPASDAAMANELYSRLQGLLTLLLSVEPRDRDAGVLDTLERLSGLLQNVRTQVTSTSSSVDGVAVIEQISQLRKLLGDIQAAHTVPVTPVATASVQALLTQLDGLQRLVAMSTVSGIKKQLAQVTDPSQVIGMVNELERLVTLLGRIEDAPPSVQEVETPVLQPLEQPPSAQEVEQPVLQPLEQPNEINEETEARLDQLERDFSDEMLSNINNRYTNISPAQLNIIKTNIENIVSQKNSILNIIPTIQRTRPRIINQQMLNRIEELERYNNVVSFNSIQELKDFINETFEFASQLQRVITNQRLKATIRGYVARITTIRDNITRMFPQT